MKNSLYVAWRGPDLREGWGPVGKLEFDAGIYRFYYTEGARKLPGFRPFTQMKDLDLIYESPELFPLFANRLLSRSRQEYEAFLQWTGFHAAEAPDPIALLGVTEGLRQTDQVEVFPCPLPDANGNYQNKFFLHGLRWVSNDSLASLRHLPLGKELTLVPEPNNTYDPHAVALHTNGHKLGYVPRYLARDVGALLQNTDGALRVKIEQINHDAPLQHRVLCLISARWPRDFEPCSGLEFHPIPKSLLVSASN